jgi:hypothetical protein
VTDELDLDRFRVDTPPIKTPSPDRPMPTERTRIRGKFLKGPIPLPWLQAAARLSGKALNVGFFLWYRRGLENTSTIKLRYDDLADFGVLPDAAGRALTKLEGANLVKTTRHKGRKPIVRLEEVHDQQ